MKYIAPALAVLLLSGCSFTQAPSPSVSYGTQAGAGSAGIHTVLPGDTVYTVSKEYNLPTRDIVTLNQLSAPYRLTTGYRLKLPPPNEYKVKSNDTLYTVSSLFDVSQNDIVRLNNLASPYRLRAGQTLRLPSPNDQAVQVATLPQPTAQRDVMQMEPAPAPGVVEREVLAAPTYQASSAGTVPPQPQAKATVQPVSAAPPKLPDTVPARTGNGKFMMPVQGKIISGYGPKSDGLHNDGINIKATKGTPVRAAENGTVVYASSELKGYGNLVIVRHADKFMTAYSHMDKILVKRGENVKAGQSIGTVGSTGNVDSPQLHFEIRKGSSALDPQKYL